MARMWGRTNLEVREHVGVVSNKESMGHVSQFFRILLSYFQRGCLLVRDDVVHEGSPTGSRVTQPHSLLRSKIRLMQLFICTGDVYPEIQICVRTITNHMQHSPEWGQGGGQTAHFGLPWCIRSCWPECGLHPGEYDQLPCHCKESEGERYQTASVKMVLWRPAS